MAAEDARVAAEVLRRGAEAAPRYADKFGTASQHFEVLFQALQHRQTSAHTSSADFVAWKPSKTRINRGVDREERATTDEGRLDLARDFVGLLMPDGREP